MGDGCFHICPNSSSYYSPEQERYDDQFYGCDRYDGWGDPELYPDYDPDDQFTDEENDAAEAQRALNMRLASAASDDDLPF
jgi:hypothetical protein